MVTMEFLTLADDNGYMMMILFAAIGGFIWFVSIIAGVFKHRSREVTRREIAAYVAEGSIDPNDGVRMMEAGVYDPDLPESTRAKTDTAVAAGGDVQGQPAQA